MLDLRPQDVPHWFDHEGDPERQWDEVRAWLADRGLGFFVVLYPGELDLRDVLDTMQNTNPGTLYMLSGTSRLGVNHTVICRGNRIEHDPSGNGIDGPIKDDGHWYIELILGYAS